MLEVNEAFERMTGHRKEEMVGRTALEVGLWVDPKERDALVDAVNKVGRATNHEVRILSKSGAIGYKRYSAELIHIGKERCMLAVGEDITERKRVQEELMRSEAFLAEGQRLSHTGSWSWNPATGEMYWSRQMFRILDLNPQTHRPSLESAAYRLHPEDRPMMERTIEWLVREKRYSEGDYRLVMPDGSLRHVHCLARPVFSASGEFLEFVGTAMDVTERKKSEEELRRLSGELLRLYDEERRGIARDLHDTTAQGLVALAATLTQLRSLVPASSRKGRKLIAESEALAKECLREVRTLSYVLYPPMLEQAGLEDAIRDFRDGFVSRTGIRVKLGIAPGLGRLGRETELALFRVTQESLANVQRHSGSPTAEVSLEHQSGVVELAVSDEGRGPVEQAENGAEFPFRIGVGIASMKERIRQVGGKLHIRSDGSGTRVRVTVPVYG